MTAIRLRVAITFTDISAITSFGTSFIGKIEYYIGRKWIDIIVVNGNLSVGTDNIG